MKPRNAFNAVTNVAVIRVFLTMLINKPDAFLLVRIYSERKIVTSEREKGSNARNMCHLGVVAMKNI